MAPIQAASRLAYDSNGNLKTVAAAPGGVPVIASQPVHAIALPGSTVTFNVRASSATGVTYQWRKAGVNIVGATLDTLTLTNVAVADEADYTVLVKNASGSVLSKVAHLYLDTDGDGMGDAKERQYFSNSLAPEALGDFDGDGVTNIDELADGTNPALATSRYFALRLSSNHGVILASPVSATGRYAPATKVTLTAKPESGYAFAEWQGTVTGLKNPLTVTMNSNVTQTAVFSTALGLALNAPELPWETGGAPGVGVSGTVGGWFGQRVTSHDGSAAGQSATLTGAGKSWVSAYVNGPAAIGFWWKRPAGSTATLKFYVDGVLYETAASGDWASSGAPIDEGRHQLRWELEQPAGTVTDATGWLDQVAVIHSKTVSLGQAMETPATLNWATDRLNPWFGLTSVADSHDGIDAAFSVVNGQFQTSWMETLVTGPGRVTFWWQAGGSELRFYVDGVWRGQSNASWEQASVDITGTGSHILRWEADTFEDLYALPESAISQVDQVVWTPGTPVNPPVTPVTYTPTQALDKLDQAWSTGGTKPWVVVTNPTWDGTDAMASGVIGNSGQSWIETKINGSGILSFYWKVDSEASKDLYTVSVDGVVQSNVSGNQGWQQRAVNIPAGLHTVRWTYIKNASLKTGADRAWLDQVTFTAGATDNSLSLALDDNDHLIYTTGGNLPWTSVMESGVDAAKSGAITHGQESWIETTFRGKGALSFWRKISTEAGFDKLSYLLDGVVQGDSSGEIGWGQLTLTVPNPGLHTIRFRYAKDSTTSSGSDAVWLDALNFTGGIIVSPASLKAPAAGGSQTLFLGGSGSWSVSETLSWITLTDNGVNEVYVAFAPNTSTVARSGTILLGGESIPISQDGVQKPVLGALLTSTTLNTGDSFTTSFVSYNSPTSWAATGLPPGLTINSTTGVISGIATAAGTYTISATAKNAAGASVPAKITVKVNPLIFAMGTGNTFAPTLNFPNAPTSFTATGLPVGVTINPTTGVISGAPTVPGTYLVTVNGRSATGVIVPYKFTMTVILPAFLAGTYTGLIQPHAALNSSLGGFATITVTTTGAVSGSLKMGGTPYPLTGRMLSSTAGGGRLNLNVNRTGLSPLTLVMTFDPGRYLGYAEGTVSDSALPANTTPVRVWGNAWHATANPATPFTGYYTNVLEIDPSLVGVAAVPQGTSYIIWTVSTSGVATWTLKLSDGTTIVGSCVVWPTGELPLFTTLYTNTGSVIGLVAIDQTKVCSGQVAWLRKLQTLATQRNYKAGFGPLTLTLVGELWVPPSAGRIVLNLPDAINNAHLDFTGGGIEAATRFSTLEQNFRITTTHLAQIPVSPITNPATLKLTVSPSTGLMSGTFTLSDLDPTPPGNKTVLRSVTYQGVMVKRLGIGAGYFLLPQLPDPGIPTTTLTSPILSGQVILEPPP